MLYVSTPCYGGVCLQAYVESMLQLQRVCSARGIPMMLDTTENESLVQRARNISLARFYEKTQATHFLFIDADIHFDPESVVRLYTSGHDISCVCYPKKCIMWHQAEEHVSTGKNIVTMSASLVVNFKLASSAIVNGFVEVLDGPTGFMMIKRDVITQMIEKYPELMCVNDHQNRDLDTYCALFDCMIDPVTRRYLSEDYAFCRRWQQMGGKIHIDCSSTIGHVGNLRFSGKLSERLKDESS